MIQDLFEASKHSLTEIYDILKELRVQSVVEESEIHDEIKNMLLAKNVAFQHEHKLGPKNRIDFLVSGGIGIEVKKRRPNQTIVTNQLTRYCDFEEVTSIILVTGKSVPLPDTINGKRVEVINLNQLWGIASS